MGGDRTSAMPRTWLESAESKVAFLVSTFCNRALDENRGVCWKSEGFLKAVLDSFESIVA